MKKRDKQRILVWLVAASTAIGLASTAIKPDPPDDVAKAASIQEHLSEEYMQSPEPTSPKVIHTIGVGNYGAEITIDNPQTPGEDNFSIYDSIVIVSGDEAVTSDVNGNFIKGQINDEDFTEITQLSEEEMGNYVFCQVSKESGADLISGNNVIANIPNGDYVLAYKSDTPEKYVKTFCTSNGNFYAGNIEKDSLKEIGDFEAISYKAEQNVNDLENVAIVNTKSDEFINLKLREQPGQAVITEIPYGSFVHVLGHTMQYGNKNWALVKYQTPDGYEYQGWVASQYLSLEVVQDKPGPKVREGISVNSTGNVTGIDVSGMSSRDLHILSENGISTQTDSVHGIFNTAELAGDIGFVGIKLGASAYSSQDLNILDYNNYVQQIASCEQEGTPYMLYYYSTSITEEEALEEASVIEERMNSLKQVYGLKHCLGVAVDKELAESTKPDRQRNGNIQEQTKSLAKLINEIQERGLSENVFIYAPGRVMQSNLDQIFDLKSLGNMLDNQENVALWLTSLMNRSGNMTQSLNKDISYAQSCGFSTAITQVVLDAKVSSGEKYDINNMDFNWYKKLTTQLKERNQTNEKPSYAIELNNPDSNRQDGDELGI